MNGTSEVQGAGAAGHHPPFMVCWLDAGGTQALCVMTDLSNPQDEADLERRIEQQRLLVARLLNESKSTVEANEALYRLCQSLAQLRHQKNLHADEPVTPSAA